MKNFLLIFSLLFCFMMKAASENPIKFGVTGALNYTSISTLADGGFKFGYKAGLSSDIPINDKFSFQPSFLFSSKGYKSDITLTDMESVVYSDGFKVNANYLELPLLFAFNMPLKNNNIFSVYAGPYLAYGVAGKTTLNGKSGTTNELPPNWNTFEGIDVFGYTGAMKLNRFDWGFSAGIAEEIGLFRISLQYDQGVKKTFGSTKSYNYGICLGLGVYL